MSSGGSVGGVSSGGSLVQKHIYVHVAPPEPEELRPQRPIGAGQSTKHYKIIFIKAPSYEQQQQQILQAQVNIIFNTLNYMCVKIFTQTSFLIEIKSGKFTFSQGKCTFLLIHLSSLKHAYLKNC